MNIDEFIEHVKEKAREHRCHADFFESDNPMRTACTKSAEDCEWLADCLTKFKEYQRLEERGRLIKLPCKVGDTYYSIEVNTDSCEECNFFQKGCYCDDWCNNKSVRDENGDTLINPQYSDDVFCKNHFYEINKCCFGNIDEIFVLREQFGKTVFLTKSEAEAKLKELRGKENE